MVTLARPAPADFTRIQQAVEALWRGNGTQPLVRGCRRRDGNRRRGADPLLGAALLMLVGIAASYLPRISVPPITPEIVLIGFLPPLYAAAIRTSVIDFRANKRPIGYLSVLLVIVTALGVGLVTWLILPVSFPVACTRCGSGACPTPWRPRPSLAGQACPGEW